MDIIVSDTNIFIDLYNCGLIHELFELPCAIHTVDLVLHELKKPDQRSELEFYVGKDLLRVKTMHDGDEIADVLVYMTTEAKGTNLSLTDCAVLCYTKELDGAKLLTGDKKLRKQAEREGLEVSGILFLLDLFVEYGIISEEEASQKLSILEESNPRLPKKEIDIRKDKWRKL